MVMRVEDGSGCSGMVVLICQGRVSPGHCCGRSEMMQLVMMMLDALMQMMVVCQLVMMMSRMLRGIRSMVIYRTASDTGD